MKTHDNPQYASLSPARKRLVDVLRELQFGRISDLSIVGGEPQWTPAPTIIQTIKLPVEAGAVDPLEGDCVLKKPVLDLFLCFDRRQRAVVSRLECRFGLPCLVEITASEESETERNTEGSGQ
jgi:hypothetical protein